MLAIEGQEFGDCDALRFRIAVLDSQYQMERAIHLADVAILLALAAQQLDPSSLNPRDDLAPLVRTPQDVGDDAEDDRRDKEKAEPQDGNQEAAALTPSEHGDRHVHGRYKARNDGGDECRG